MTVESFNGALLHEPWTIQNQSGKPFQVLNPVSHAIAREVALEAFDRIKSTRPERRRDPEPMGRKGRRART
jgi:hypothetical protein